jgi:hypothetical protein
MKRKQVSRNRDSLHKSRSAAPGWQGATTERIGNTGGRSNAASRDAPPPRNHGSGTLACLAAAAAMGCGLAAHAHHSQVAVYNMNGEQRIEGRLVQVLIRSPHSFVHVEAEDEHGEMQRYAIEWGSVAQLRNQGVDGRTLRIGDHVRILGRPGRNAQDHRMLMVHIERPDDGWTWGNAPGEVVD